MARLSPVEEQRLAHSFHNYSSIGVLLLLLSTGLLAIVAYDHRQYSVRISAFNFGWTFDIAFTAGRERMVEIDEVDLRHWDAESEFMNIAYHKYNSEEEAKVIENIYQRPNYEEIIKNPEKSRKNGYLGNFIDTNRPFLRDVYYVEFGATVVNKCNFPAGGRPVGLPSILRTMELSWTAQLTVRLIVLSLFFVRWYFTFIRCKVRNTHSDFCRHILSYVIPKVQLLEMTFAFLLATLQQGNDSELAWTFPIVIIGFAVSIGTYMLLYTLMSLVDRSKKPSSRLAQIRIACLTICIFCSPIWVQNHLQFIEWKSCFPEVPIRDALCEYITVAATIAFAVTQLYEMRNYFGLLSCSRQDCIQEVNAEFYNKYKPADSEIRTTTISNRQHSTKKCSESYLVDA